MLFSPELAFVFITTLAYKYLLALLNQSRGQQQTKGMVTDADLNKK